MQSRFSYANVASTIALVLALGGGAYAAVDVLLPRNSVRAKQIAKGAVRSPEAKNLQLGDLGFPLDLRVQYRNDPLTPPANTFTTIFSETMTLDHAGPLAVIGAVEVEDFGQAVQPTEVRLRVLMDGQPEEMEFTGQVAQNATETIPVVIPCNLVPPGTHTLEVQVALNQGSTLHDRALNAYTGPVRAEPPPSP